MEGELAVIKEKIVSLEKDNIRRDSRLERIETWLNDFRLQHTAHIKSQEDNFSVIKAKQEANLDCINGKQDSIITMINDLNLDFMKKINEFKIEVLSNKNSDLTKRIGTILQWLVMAFLAFKDVIFGHVR